MSTQQIAESAQASGIADNKSAAKAGDCIAAQARNQLESLTDKLMLTGVNELPSVGTKAAAMIKSIKSQSAQ